MSLLTIKIFVSSPGDVAQERFLTEKVVARLQNVYCQACTLEPIFWEHEPLTADQGFQEGLISPRETDIVVCILWSRLGTRLPKNVTGGENLTGTEFEVREALAGRREKGIPALLIYRKLAKAFTDLSDLQRSAAAVAQRAALEAFLDQWFKDVEGALIAAFHPFERADQFEEHLEIHLRKLIDRRLAAAGIAADRLGPAPTWLEGSPFRGLQHFDFQHEPIFFGRTKAIGEVIDRLKRQAEAGRAFLLVLGTSGCGKSSLIRAGVLPALSRPGVIEGVGLCRRVILRPGQGDVFAALAAALLEGESLPELARDGTTAAQLARSLRDHPAGAAMMVKGAISQAAAALNPAGHGARQPQARLLLVVDQLEELFTNDRISAEDRRQFAQVLTSLACDPLSQTWVLATLRSDFYAPLTQVPELGALKEGLGQYDLLFPSPAEIGLLVREPASAAGLRFEQRPAGERLDDVLHNVVARDASLLPLLEFTLNELYEQQDRRATERGMLTFADYQAMGGVEGALAQRAEATFRGLAEEVRSELPAVFRQLVTVGTLSEETATSQQAPLSRFATSPARMWFVESFIAARLFVSGHAADGTAAVRITHESLLARWGRLQRWLAEDRDLLRVKARVQVAAARWTQEGRRADLLLAAGKPLLEAEQLQASRFELEPEVEALIGASRNRARRNRRLRQAAVALLAMLTLAACGLAVFAQIQQRRAVAARTATELANRQLQQTNADLIAARKEANRQLAVYDIDHGMSALENGDRLGLAALARAYRATDDLRQLRAGVRALLGAWDLALPRVIRHADPLEVKFTRDGTHIVIVNDKATFWDTATGEPRSVPWDSAHAARAIGISDDASTIATACDDKTLRLRDAATGQPRGVPVKVDWEFETVRASPDWSKVAVYTERCDKHPVCNTVCLWDALTGKPLGTPLTRDGQVSDVLFSPNGTKLVVFSLGSGQFERRTEVSLWDVATGKPIGMPLTRDGVDDRALFSPDGAKLAILTECSGTYPRHREARMWDTATGKALGLPLEIGDEGCCMAFSPDGTKLATAGGSGGLEQSTGQVWDTATGKPLGTPLPHEGEVTTVAFSPDGTKVATTSSRRATSSTVGGESRLWDAATGKPLCEPLPHAGEVTAVAFSPDGTVLGTASVDGTARLWDVATGKLLGEPLRHDGKVQLLAFSPDGTIVATTSDDGTILLWDAATSRPLCHEPISNGPWRTVIYSRDGKKLAAASVRGLVQVWDRATGKRDDEWQTEQRELLALAFSPDSTKVATGGFWGGREGGGYVQLWDIAAYHEKLGAAFHSRFDRPFREVTAVAFSPDGAILAAGTADGQVLLWIVATGQLLSGPLHHPGQIVALAFSPQGAALLSLSEQAARLWHPATGMLLREPLKQQKGGRFLSIRDDASRIATLCDDQTVRLWDAATDKPLGRPLKCDGTPTAAAFHPDGTKIGIATDDVGKTTGQVRVWDVATGKPLGAPLKHAGRIAALVFHPDGTQIATLGDEAMDVWHTWGSLPDDPQWLAAYVTAVTQAKEDADHQLHPMSGEEAFAVWPEILKSPAWLEQRARILARTRRMIHENAVDRQQDRQQDKPNWFVAAFHRRWLCAQEPTNADFRRCLGGALAEQGHFADAYREYRVACGLAPEDADLKYTAALAAWAANDRTAFRSYVPGLLTFYNWQSGAPLAVIGGDGELQLSAWIDVARRSLADDKNRWDLHAGLSGLLYRAGNYSEAIRESSQAIAMIRKEHEPPPIFGETDGKITMEREKSASPPPEPLLPTEAAEKHGEPAESYFAHAVLALAYQRLGNAAQAQAERRMLWQIADKSPADNWKDRVLREILDAEIRSICGPQQRPQER